MGLFGRPSSAPDVNFGAVFGPRSTPTPPDFIPPLEIAYQKFQSYSIFVDSAALPLRLANAHMPVDAIYIYSPTANTRVISIGMGNYVLPASAVGPTGHTNLELWPGQLFIAEIENTRTLLDSLSRLVGKVRRIELDAYDFFVNASAGDSNVINVVLASKSDEGY